MSSVVRLRGSTPEIALPADVRPRFDHLRCTHGRDALARMLGSSRYTIERLEQGGTAIPSTVDRVADALRRLP